MREERREEGSGGHESEAILRHLQTQGSLKPNIKDKEVAG